MNELNKRKIGTEYENMAAEYLIEKGYQILERNYRNKIGEIDIIAQQTDTIVYVEIKYRSSDKYGNPLDAVDYKKQKRISKVAMLHYVQNGARLHKQCRFDVIGIYADGRIQHVENAFYYQE